MSKAEIATRFEAGSLTYGMLMDLVDETLLSATARGEANDTSSVNPSLSHAQALDIFARALAGHPVEQVVDVRSSRAHLFVTNIVKECF